LNDTTLIYNDNKIELTKNEYKILQLLMGNIGRVVSRDEIMQHLWNSDQFIDDNTLTVNMTRLRKKLSKSGLDNYIKTKKGLGYLVE
jgi:two-component system response regulator protein BraR/BceR